MVREGPSGDANPDSVLQWWTSVGHTALQTDSWHDGSFFLGASLTIGYLQQSVSLSDTHSLHPGQFWFLPPRTGFLITDACSSSPFGAPGSLGGALLIFTGRWHSSEHFRVEEDSGLWALLSALAQTSNIALGKSLLFSEALFPHW